MRAAGRPERRPGPLLAALIAGIAAGSVATAVELVLWWLAGMPVAATLWRDARLTAALAMGPGVLPPPATPRADILLAATMIHFALSVAYAALALRLWPRLSGGAALLAGAGYGLLIYVVNLYGMTQWFPWFAAARDGVTLAAHLVFGVTLAGCGRWLAART